jgi:glutathione synthase/RimK-type ligase-like ATP-grasp enzyme
MKKIGILHGKETSFPEAFVARVNSKNVKACHAEPTLVDELMQGEPTPYAVMIDRISQDVPFYRAYLKNAALNGTAVLNNPFWWSADEKFFNNCLSTKIGVPVPKTILLAFQRNAARHLWPEFPQPEISTRLGKNDRLPRWLPTVYETPLGRRLEKRVQSGKLR